MKVSTEYGSTSTIKQNQVNNKKWSCEKVFSFIMASVTIFCVIGYIAYELNQKYQPKKSPILKDKNDIALSDLSEISSAATIRHCDDEDDISYDSQFGEYSYEQDIQSVVNGVVNNWDLFEETMRRSTPDSTFISCFHDKMLQSNILCKMSCSQNVNAYIDGIGIIFCEDMSLDVINKEWRPNRLSCIFKEIAYQYVLYTIYYSLSF